MGTNSFLVVDDKSEILNLLKWEVVELGEKAFVADTCQKAIMLLKDIEFKAIFLDIVLKNESSEEIVKFIKSFENIINKNIKIILISGHIDEEFKAKYSSSFYKIMEKPFESDSVSEVITQLLKVA